MAKRDRGKHIARNLRFRHGSYQAYVWVAGKRVDKVFPATTPRFEIDTWIATQKQNAKVAQVDRARANNPPPRAVVPRDEGSGYCYIYFVRSGMDVKIGRALDVDARLSDLQIAHPRPLSLLVAVPAHASLEPIIHRRFAHLRGFGEWFHLGTDLQNFICALQLGKNPVELMWADLVYLDARRTRRKPINILTTPVDKVDAILGTNGGSHEPTPAHDRGPRGEAR